MNKKVDTHHKMGGHIQSPQTRNESTDKSHPIFSLEGMRRDYDVTDCQKDDQAQFACKLRELSKLTWIEIINAPRHGIGSEKIDINQIRGDGVNHLPEDVVLLSIRFSGEKAMIGYRDGMVFHIIWLDHHFNLYPHS